MQRTDTLLAKIQAADSGLRCVYSHSSQEYVSYEYGYAWVRVYGSTEKFPTRVLWRKEGDGAASGTASAATRTVKDEADLVQLCVAVLRTGRTVECGQGVQLRMYQNWPPTRPTDYPISYLTPYGVPDETWDLNPDYQRGPVWTDQQAELFLGHLISGAPVPPIYIQRFESLRLADTPPSEVIDGQQRIRAIRRWLAHEIAAQMDDGYRVWFRHLNEIEVRRLPDLHVLFVDLPRVERLQLYIRLNSGGTVHTKAEIQRVCDLLAAEVGVG